MQNLQHPKSLQGSEKEGEVTQPRLTAGETVCVCVCVCVCVLAVQSCLTLCNPMDCRPPGSSFHGIFQATMHALLRGSLPHPGIEPGFPALQADSLLGGQWKDIHEMEEK